MFKFRVVPRRFIAEFIDVMLLNGYRPVITKDYFCDSAYDYCYEVALIDRKEIENEKDM